MQIREISVTGLFGIFDHVIPLQMDNRITIIHSPNGFGKTSILRMLNGLFNSRYSVFRTIPFHKFRVNFDNDSSIEVVKSPKRLLKREDINIDFYKLNSKVDSFPLQGVEDRDFPVDMLEKIIPDLVRVRPTAWRYLPTGEILPLNEVMDRFADFLPPKIKLEEPEWLENLKHDIHIRLIESQRLLNFASNRSSKIYSESSSRSTVSIYSRELAQLIQSKLAEYGSTAQTLDRTFPSRVVKQHSSPDLTEEQLRFQLNELETSRSRLIDLGLLNKDENSDFQIQPQAIDAIDKSTKNILSVYVEDTEKKLRVFSEIANKIELLRRMINHKFSYKQISFNGEKGFIFKTPYPASANTDTLSPKDLSSGEQHELVLLYELLFKVQPNSLILIDEPELSLHVGWQVQFLKDLQEITKLVGLDILMATHSPDIIQDRWDLTVELKGPTP